MLARRLPALQSPLRRCIASQSSRQRPERGPTDDDNGKARRSKSIFEELFPDTEPTPEPSNLNDNNANSRAPRPPPPSTPSPHLHDAHLAPFLTPSPPPPTNPPAPRLQPTTLHLTAATPSLHPTDFTRLAPAGAHLPDWPQGLSRVVQARDPTTLAAQGAYTLHFDSAGAAAAYAETAQRLHVAARRAVWPVATRDRAFRAAFQAPMRAGPVAEAERRAYVLAPPAGRLRLVSAGEGNREGEGEEAGPMALLRRGRVDVAARVLLWLEGGHMAVSDVRAVIRDDGVARNMSWALLGGGEDVLPVKWLVGLRTPVERATLGEVRRRWLAGRPGHEEEEMLVRFVVSFQEAVEARRFVRNWHRRLVKSPGNGREVLVNASSLW